MISDILSFLPWKQQDRSVRVDRSIGTARELKTRHWWNERKRKQAKKIGRLPVWSRPTRTRLCAAGRATVRPRRPRPAGASRPRRSGRTCATAPTGGAVRFERRFVWTKQKPSSFTAMECRRLVLETFKPSSWARTWYSTNQQPLIGRVYSMQVGKRKARLFSILICAIQPMAVDGRRRKGLALSNGFRPGASRRGRGSRRPRAAPAPAGCGAARATRAPRTGTWGASGRRRGTTRQRRRRCATSATCPPTAPARRRCCRTAGKWSACASDCVNFTLLFRFSFNVSRF